MENLIEVKTVAEYLLRIKNNLSVSRFQIKLNFEWDAENSKKLSSADLRFANLSSADLRCADLSSANLRSANLSSADLRCADLRCADLSCANLRSADLRSADLSSADLRSADLSYAKGEFIFNYGVKLKVVTDGKLD